MYGLLFFSFLYDCMFIVRKEASKYEKLTDQLTHSLTQLPRSLASCLTHSHTILTHPYPLETDWKNYQDKEQTNQKKKAVKFS